MVRAFALPLLAESFNDRRSMDAIRKIVLSVVKLSDPRWILGQFGTRFRALPGILRILLVEGHIETLALTHELCLEDLISELQAGEKFGSVTKFNSLTNTVLDNIASIAGKLADPKGISGEEAVVVDHFLTPGFILERSGTGKMTYIVYKLVERY
ncbi:hypothetical protein B9Z19DRAFT_1137946 [Tuber borchii]|uniref:Uncharacterized protein n=1 Tax=Tuber borchii TaxID=42251 RepID=A0A2T6ZA26_TUBBO|nr:hypothetical protein B9Z19DRAFT_1137946 [Tuber borchii]